MIKKTNKIRLKLFSFYLILIAILLISINILYNLQLNNKEEKKVESFFSEHLETKKMTDKKLNFYNENDYFIGILEIPTINLKRGFYSIEHKNNIVDKNIQVIKSSSMPNVKNGMMIIAGHSGSGKTSYFKNLNNLELSNYVYIYYLNLKYIYEIIEIYTEEKDGTISINKNENDTLLILTTCSQTDKTKQIVIVSKQIKTLTY